MKEEPCADNLLLKAKDAAFRLLVGRDYSELEIRKKLEQKQFPAEIINDTVHYLKEHRYLDEERLIASYLAGNRKTKSKRMILLKLKEKGISEGAVCRIMEEEGWQDSMALVCALQKKLNGKNIEDLTWEEKQKINAYLYRKGFMIDDIRLAWLNCYQEIN